MPESKFEKSQRQGFLGKAASAEEDHTAPKAPLKQTKVKKQTEKKAESEPVSSPEENS